MPHELKGWSRPRPLRVAFLIEDGEHASLTLDGVFADCYDRWGGRFSLIAPCVNSRIAPSYWPWLEAYDPDTGRFSVIGMLTTGRFNIKPVLLPDGTVLIAGGDS